MKAQGGPGSEKDRARFCAKVAPVDGNGCMLWTGQPNRAGYGRFWLGRKNVLAHRLAYELAYGAIPDGLVIDHVRANGCRHRHCVAPLHLEAVTNAENVRRGDTGINNAVKTHCPQGHEYTPRNTHMHITGSRRCRECGRIRWRAWNERRADAVS